MRNTAKGMRGLDGLYRGRFFSIGRDGAGPRSVNFTARALRVADDFSVLGLSPFASKTDVKYAYKRLALKYHPDVIKVENERPDIFKEIKSAYESLMIKFEEADYTVAETGDCYGEEDWEEWMGFEGGMPIVYNPL